MKTFAYSSLTILHLVYLLTIFVWYATIGNGVVQELLVFDFRGFWEQFQDSGINTTLVILAGIYPFYVIPLMIAGWWFIDKHPKSVLWLTAVPLFFVLLVLGVVFYFLISLSQIF
ncbi:hypothetical protein CF394_06620 [Tetzosporium hominis]|uniref:Uncharacterized protein n=1 Tax=Tetzosporium hominis TaxID=2020506 RepID=A0A264W5V4_9BACL|nr:hypothetical protein [Tetzosporium hominis]OZS78427.1 hypothetical protein CF394_06620 [Tetzosporium hominis]